MKNFIHRLVGFRGFASVVAVAVISAVAVGGFPSVRAAAPGEVIINEFVSNPSIGDLEWIELLNKTGSDIDLSGWKLIDGNAQTSDDLILTGIIPAHSFFVFNGRVSTWLNNPGDSITLKDRAENIINSIAYGSWENHVVSAPPQGQSASFYAGAWTLGEPTRGVKNGNTAPVVEDLSISTNEGAPVHIALIATDADFDSLRLMMLNLPVSGELVFDSGNEFAYTPRENFFGADSFTFKANDGTADSRIATVSITVNSANTAPIAVDQSVVSAKNLTKDITLSASDVDGDSLTYEIVDEPTHGILGGVSGNHVAYTPNASYIGSDSFTFKAIDSHGAGSNPATVTITIPVNTAPIAYGVTADQAAHATQGRELTISLIASDPDGDRLTYDIVDAPAHGTAYILGTDSSGKAVYLSDGSYSGADSFTFKATDSNGVDSNVATISISIDRANQMPIATTHQSHVGSADVPTVINLLVNDPDNDPLTFSIVTAPTLGSVSFNGSTAVYTPRGVVGTDIFSYKANDGRLDSGLATVTITLAHGVISRIAISASPATLVAGETAVITVKSQDQFGNTMIVDNSTVVHLSAGNLGNIENTVLTLSSGEKTTTLTKSGVGTVRVSAWSGTFAPVEISVVFTAPSTNTNVLGVTQIAAAQSFAAADGTFENGWKWVFSVTVPTNETGLQMKFADWVSGSNSIAAAQNIRYYSSQSSNVNSAATALSIGSAGAYDEGTMTLNADLDSVAAGRQIQITVEARVPANSAGGSYSTSYGIKSQ